MDTIVFFVVHHATSDFHTELLRRCVSSIRQYHEKNRIIVCKTSTSDIPDDIRSLNIDVFNTKYDGSHIFGAMNILAELTNIDRYIIMHDSMLLLKELPT